MILFFINLGKNFGNIVPIITLYVIAGYRLLPAAQQIFASIASIRSTKSAFDNLYSDLQNLKITKQKKIKKKINISLSKFILLKNIVFRYPGSKETILKKINLKIPAFAKIGIVGETGSGKTTLVDIILGLLDPNKGKILIDGKSINRNNKKFWQENIGYVSQDIYLSDNTLAENIAFGIDLQNINYDLVKQSAKIANIDNFIDNKLPQKYSTVVGERGVRLSGGQRQRIGIARALYQKPRVLILDEATSALDNINEKIIINNINQLKDKITLIVIAHRLSTIKNYDLILVLHEGKLVAKGSFDKLKKTNNIFRNLISKSKFKV
jgi:ABC-type multidrug transport system fused ATPase/permease subunit